MLAISVLYNYSYACIPLHHNINNDININSCAQRGKTCKLYTYIGNVSYQS